MFRCLSRNPKANGRVMVLIPNLIFLKSITWILRATHGFRKIRFIGKIKINICVIGMTAGKMNPKMSFMDPNQAWVPDPDLYDPDGSDDEYWEPCGTYFIGDLGEEDINGWPDEWRNEPDYYDAWLKSYGQSSKTWALNVQ